PQQADLALSKGIDNARPNVGDTVTFTVSLTNQGPDAATGVSVRDLLPAGLTFLAAAPSQGSYASATGLWTVGTVAAGAAPTLTLQARVATAAPLTNTATVSAADQFDPVPGYNRARATETPQQADLALSKAVDNPTPNVGGLVTFTITLADRGPDPATNVQVTDLLPAGLTFSLADPSQGAYDPATGVWDVGTVTPGAPATLTLSAVVAAPGTLTNTATISAADQFDPSTANNSASASETAQQADLALAKAVSNRRPNVGDTITLTITLTNAGPDPAT